MTQQQEITLHVFQVVYEWAKPDTPPTFQASPSAAPGLNTGARYPGEAMYVKVGECTTTIKPLDWSQITQAKVAAMRNDIGAHRAAITDIERDIANLLAIEHTQGGAS